MSHFILYCSQMLPKNVFPHRAGVGGQGEHRAKKGSGGVTKCRCYFFFVRGSGLARVMQP